MKIRELMRKPLDWWRGLDKERQQNLTAFATGFVCALVLGWVL